MKLRSLELSNRADTQTVCSSKTQASQNNFGDANNAAESMSTVYAGFVNISESSLFVKRFPKEWDEAVLAELFSPYGTIESIFLPRDEAGVSKQWALVDFQDYCSAEQARIALHNVFIREEKNKNKKKNKKQKSKKGLPLYVSRAQRKVDRKETLKKRWGTAYNPSHMYKEKLSILVPPINPTHFCEECCDVSPTSMCQDHDPKDWMSCDRCSYDPYDQWGSPGVPIGPD